MNRDVEITNIDIEITNRDVEITNRDVEIIKEWENEQFDDGNYDQIE